MNEKNSKKTKDTKKIEEATLLMVEKKVKKRSKDKETKPKQLENEISLVEETSPKTKITKSKRATKKVEDPLERYTPQKELGLTTEEVEKRVAAGYHNYLKRGSSKSIGKIFFDNIVSIFNILLMTIAGFLFAVGAPILDFMFLPVMFANITVGIYQEIKAKRMIDKLSILSAPTALVVRDGFEQEIAIANLVLDDILHLKSGKQIPADANIISGAIEVNESLLTGESNSITKNKGEKLLSGSFVVSGHCYAVVSAVGKNSFIEKMTHQAKTYVKPKSELLRSLKFILSVVAVISVGLGLGLYFLMMKNPGLGLSQQEVVIKTAGAMIGMIPSGLFLLTSTALMVGVTRLGKHHALVQELYSIEMLARIDMLCLDKTGTITDGTMSVNSVIEYNNKTGLSTRNIVSSMLNALEDGNQTSQALEKRFGRGKKIRDEEIIHFSSVRKYSAVKFVDYGTFAFGAPEFVLKNNYSKIKEVVEKHSKNGFRVLVLAHTNNVTAIKNGVLNTDLDPLALIIIEDTIRPDAADTIKYFVESGVAIRVISGDNPMTVSRISERAGVPNANEYISLDGLSDREVVHAAKSYHVFGRVNPEQKKLLITTFKADGHTVAMTGDGVNDILALKEADTSIAMASGSEAVRSVSHLVLLDSNFASMPKVVSEGRRVINNVQRVSALFLTKTLFSIFLAILAMILGGEYPISPSQLIIIDMFVTGIPALILALEPNNEKLQGRFLWNVMKNALPGAIVIVINSFILFMLYQSNVVVMNPKEFSTLIVITATFTSFMVLLRVSKPMNKTRIILFVSMLGAFMICLFGLPHWFKLIPIFGPSSLKVDQILLLLVIVQLSYPLIHLLTNIIPWGKSAVNFIVTKIQNMSINGGE